VLKNSSLYVVKDWCRGEDLNFHELALTNS
jgi:hypothetical protein